MTDKEKLPEEVEKYFITQTINGMQYLFDDDSYEEYIDQEQEAKEIADAIKSYG